MIKTLLLLLLTLPCLAQRTIPFENSKKLNKDIYEAISPYQIIWIGEMHGANEPVEFAEGVTRLLLKNDQKVTFGLEIKEEDLPEKIDSLSLINSPFGKTYENRATFSWLNLILTMEQNHKVKTIYFDENNRTISNDGRDSLMAVNILNNWDQKSTLVLLSGNLHNMQEPRNGSKKAGLHLLELTNQKFKMLSLSHSFKKGQINTSYTDDNGKVKQKEFNYSDRKWAQKPIYQQNHLHISKALENGWNGYFYIEEVSPGKLLNP